MFDQDGFCVDKNHCTKQYKLDENIKQNQPKIKYYSKNESDRVGDEVAAQTKNTVITPRHTVNSNVFGNSMFNRKEKCYRQLNN